MKWASWFRRHRYFLLIGVGLLLLYPAGGFWWHSSGSQWVSRHFVGLVDPFAAPTVKWKIHQFIYHRVFPPDYFNGWLHRYSRWTSPFKPARTPEGRSYFPPDFPTGYEDEFSLFSWSGLLRRCGEPSLFELPEDLAHRKIIRLTIAGPYLNEAFTCRISGPPAPGESATATYVWVDRKSGKTTHRVTQKFPDASWQSIEPYLLDSSLWDPLSNEEESLDSPFGSSESWLFEIIDETGYRHLSLVPPATLAENAAERPHIKAVRDFRKLAHIGELIDDASPLRAPASLPPKLVSPGSDPFGP